MTEIPKNQGAATTSLPRLGAHHFACARAVAQGISVADAARRYLGVTHGNAAGAAYRDLVARLRVVARRSGARAWRLVGVEIHAVNGPSVQPRPIKEWAENPEFQKRCISRYAFDWQYCAN